MKRLAYFMVITFSLVIPLIISLSFNQNMSKQIEDKEIEILKMIEKNQSLESEISRYKDEKEEMISLVAKKDEHILLLSSLEISLEETVLREFYKKETGNEFGEVKEVSFELTKYTNSEGWWAKSDPNYGMMASGAFTYRGAAAAPRSIPFGSTVIITTEGLPHSVEDNTYTVGDRGGAIVERDDGTLCIDIWVPEENLSDAYSFGRRFAEGYIIIPLND